MAFAASAAPDDVTAGLPRPARIPLSTGAAAGAVSWSAIAAGGAAAASLSLILLMLGVGLGLSSVSPWAHDGLGAVAFGVSTIVWLTLTQLLASAMGGYLAGRLRTRWSDVHGDEVYFRDTAHGFLAWAVASLATAALLTSAIGGIVGSGVQAAASVAGGTASAAGAGLGALAGAPRGAASTEAGPAAAMAYAVDALFRPVAAVPSAATGTSASANANANANVSGPATPLPGAERATARDLAEVGRILGNLSSAQPLPADDVRYVGQLVAQRTGLSQQDAEQRVTAVLARAQARFNEAQGAARAAADQARKASATSALWLFISLLSGAFVASLAATLGGRRRDA